MQSGTPNIRRKTVLSLDTTFAVDVSGSYRCGAMVEDGPNAMGVEEVPGFVSAPLLETLGMLPWRSHTSLSVGCIEGNFVCIHRQL